MTERTSYHLSALGFNFSEKQVANLVWRLILVGFLAFAANTFLELRQAQADLDKSKAESAIAAMKEQAAEIAQMSAGQVSTMRSCSAVKSKT